MKSGSAEAAVSGAGPGRSGRGWSVADLRADAARAREAGAQDEAVRLLERALEDAGSEELRLEVLLELAAAEARTRPDDAIRHFRLALPLLEAGETRFWTRIRTARCLGAAGRVGEALQEVDASLADATTDEERLRAEVAYVSLSRQSLDTRPLGRGRLAALAGATPAATGPASRAVIGELAYERVLSGAPVAEVLETAMAALGGPSLSGLHEMPPLTRQVVLLTLSWCGEQQIAQEAAERVLARAERRGAAVDAASAHSILANVYWRRGALIEAAEAADRVVHGAAGGFRAVLPSMLATKAMALAARGEIDAALSALQLPGGDDEWAASASYHGYLIGRARVRLAAGDDEGAYRAALHCGTLANAMGTTNPAVLPWRALAAEAAVNLGRHDEAVALAEEELLLARQFGAPNAVAAAARVMARMRDDEAAVTLLVEAVSLQEKAVAPDRVERIRVALDLAERLARLGRQVEASASVGRATALAEEIGATPLLEAATALLSSLTQSQAVLDRTPGDDGGRTAPTSAPRAERRVTIHALGGFAVTGPDGTDLTPPGLPGKAVRVLVAAGRSMHVEQLADLLWDDVPSPERIRARLRTILNRARSCDGPLIVRHGDLLALDPEVVVDADRFEAAARAALGEGQSPQRLEQTVAASVLYAGDLLPSDPYAEWAALRREQLRMKYLVLCDRGAALAIDNGLPDLAVDLLEAAISHDPYDDERIDRAAAILAAAGRPAAARAMAERAARTRRSLGF